MDISSSQTYSHKPSALFIKALVEANLLVEFDTLGDEEKIEAILKVTHDFVEYLVAYITEKYGIKEALRLKAAYMYSDTTVLDKYPELDEIAKEATNNYINQLKIS
jgi:hypothetical protein